MQPFALCMYHYVIKEFCLEENMKNIDTELIQQILNGNQDSFTALVKKYQKQVHAFAWWN